MDNGSVWIYAADVKALYDVLTFAEGYQKVSASRQEKINRFVFQKDKVLSLGAELLLQECLKKHGVISYTLALDVNGKPYLDACVYSSQNLQKPLYFNLSHSEERVLCAISDREVGCDVEKVRDIGLEIAKHFFTPEEYENICSQSTKEKQNRYFFKYWTLKESCMKVTGKGILHALKDCALVKQRLLGYHFKEYSTSDGYQYAVCSKAEYFSEKLEWMDLNIK